MPRQIAELKMGALLAVAQGSVRPARVAIMQWHGAKSKRAKPLAFIGKGVVFDTGGISIKPAAGMEDMKGDMGGAACVVGLMHALAERKAQRQRRGPHRPRREHAVGHARRAPATSSRRTPGQTVEILNTDAEGRLVLADLISYAQERFKPRLIIDLATLTGAIMVALGKEYAGLFVNDDKLANDLLDASRATGEKVWRMPLDKAYDKMIESQERRHQEHRRALGGRLHGGGVPQVLRQGHAVGAHRSRRHGDGRAEVGDQPELGLGLGRAAARPVRRRQVREGREVSHWGSVLLTML